MEVIFDTSRLGGFVSSQGTTCRCESLPYVRPIKFFFLIFFPTSSKKVMLSLLSDSKQNTTNVGFT